MMQQDSDFSATGAAGGASILSVHQRLPTSGARTALPFELEGALCLIVPQLAQDKPGEPAHMNGGDSDIDAIVYRWDDGRFVEHERVAVTGGEDATVFAIDGTTFLATASVRSGAGPYQMNARSIIYRRERGAWVVHQSVASFAGKQWHHFSFDGRHFLGLAQGVTLPHAVPTVPRESRIYEWRDGMFEEFQALEGGWGYNYAYFELAGERFLGYADHTRPSLIYRWDGTRFAPFQTIADTGGRAFKFFERDGAAWLAFANIDGDSTLYRWDGSRFVAHQVLGGKGGREFELIRARDDLYLVRVCFIQGTPAAPKTDLLSQIYRWTGAGFEQIEQFPTYGGTDASAFTADGKRFLAVSNSLTPDVRFRQDMVVYQLAI